MTGSAIFVMILGMLILWGGFIYSVTHAIKKSKEAK